MTETLFHGERIRIRPLMHTFSSANSVNSVQGGWAMDVSLPFHGHVLDLGGDFPTIQRGLAELEGQYQRAEQEWTAE